MLNDDSLITVTLTFGELKELGEDQEKAELWDSVVYDVHQFMVEHGKAYNSGAPRQIFFELIDLAKRGIDDKES